MKKIFLIIPFIGLLFILSSCKPELREPQDIIKRADGISLYENGKRLADYEVLKYSKDDIQKVIEDIDLKKAPKNTETSRKYVEIESHPYVPKSAHYDLLKIYDSGLVYIYSKNPYQIGNSKKFLVDIDKAKEIIDIAYNQYNEYLDSKESNSSLARLEGCVESLITRLNEDTNNRELTYLFNSDFSDDMIAYMNTVDFEFLDIYNNETQYHEYEEVHNYDGLYKRCKIESFNEFGLEFSGEWSFEVIPDTDIWVTYSYTDKYTRQYVYYYHYEVSASVGRELLNYL